LTVRGYTGHVRSYLVPHLGTVLLAELSTGQVQAMFTAIIRRRVECGRPISPSTLAHIRATLRAALNGALRQGLISYNPACRVELPAARRPRAVVWTSERVAEYQRTGVRPPVAVWTAGQTAQFLRAIRDHRMYAVYHLIALRGLRRGEAAGLRWCDIDLDARVAMIGQQLQQYDGQVAVAPPKTARSSRVVALDRTTVAVLRRHRLRQLAERDAAGPDYRDSGYVFTTVRGDPFKPDRLSRRFQELCQTAGLPPVRLHDLRHGAATLALAAGVDLKVVQDMLGHASIVLTADTYTSVLPQVAHQAAEAVADLIVQAGRLVPGTGRARRRASAQPRPWHVTVTGAGTVSRAHPARQLGHPPRGHARPAA
jgi:integrase